MGVERGSVGVGRSVAAVCMPWSVLRGERGGRRRLAAVMVMERLAHFVSKSLEGGEAPAPPDPGAGDVDDVDVDITALEEAPASAAKRPRNWLLSPEPACKREAPLDDDDEHRHGESLKPSSVLQSVSSKF